MRLTATKALAVLAFGSLALAACSGSSKHATSSPTVPTEQGSGPTSGHAHPSASVGSSSPNATSRPSLTEPAGGPVPRGFAPYSTTFVSPMQGWVLGTAPCSTKPCTSVVRTEDGGKTWVGIPAPKATLQTSLARPAQVARIRFADASDGWAFDSALYSTHNGGRTWAEQSLGSDGRGDQLIALDSGGGYVEAVVDPCSPYTGARSCTHVLRVYRARIDSDRWTRVASINDSAPGGGYFHAELVTHGSDWWLSANGVYRASGGQAVTRLNSPCAGATLAVADRAHLDALCSGGGAAGSSRQQLYGTSDGGTHWKPSGAAFRGQDNITGTADNTRGVLLISESGGGSVIVRTTDDGRSIHPALSPHNSGGAAWTDLGFTNPTQAVVVLTAQAMYLSHDAGTHWAPTHF